MKDIRIVLLPGLGLAVALAIGASVGVASGAAADAAHAAGDAAQAVAAKAVAAKPAKSPSPRPEAARRRVGGAASGAAGAVGRGVSAATAPGPGASRAPSAADMLKGKYAPVGQPPKGPAARGQAAPGGELADAPPLSPRHRRGGGAVQPQPDKIGPGAAPGQGPQMGPQRGPQANRPAPPGGGPPSHLGPAPTPLPGTTPLPGFKPPADFKAPEGFKPPADFKAPEGFKPPPNGKLAVPGFKPPGTGSLTARPAQLPPLPGQGKIVPPPPALPGITPMEPLAPSTGAPMVAPGVPLGTSSVRILSDFVRYDRQSKQAVARGNVKIYQEDVVISTSEAQYDQQNKITNIRVPFELLQTKEDEPPTTLKGKALTAYHGSKHVVVEGDVWLRREGVPTARPANPSRKEKLKTAFKREETIISGDHMDYWTNTKDAKFDGSVKFFQKEKYATSDHALIDNKKKKIYMTDKVVLTQVKGDWLIRNDIVDASKPDKERDEALRETTVMTGDRMEVDQDTNDAVMTGAMVTVTQKGKRATGKRAEYNDKLQQITLTQDVRIAKDDGGWITADRAVFHTESEKFEAYGAKGIQVETEFKLDENKQGAK